MKFGIGLRVRGNTAAFDATNWVDMRYSNGITRLLIDHPTIKDMDHLIDLLVAENISVVSINVGLEWDEQTDVLNQSEISHFILSADDMQRLTAFNNHFEPELPDPCLGIVPSKEPIHISQKPVGCVAAVLPDYQMYSQACFNILQDFGDCKSSEVIYKGETLRNWFRIWGRPRLVEFNDFTVRTVPCRRCGCESLNRTLGIIVAAEPLTDDIYFGSFPLGHVNHREGIVVSKSVAKVMRQQLRGKFALDPIFNHDSLIGLQILAILEPLRKAELWPLK